MQNFYGPSIIGALNITTLHFPHNDVLAWTHDANVFLSKYIPLVVTALLFLLCLCLPYTLLLLLSQWLELKSHIYLSSWVNNSRLKAILDTLQATASVLDQCMSMYFLTDILES